MKKITLIAMVFAMAFVAHAQTLTITAVKTKTQAEFLKSSARLLAVLNGETRADSTQKQDSTLSIIVFAKGVKAEISKEEYNRILDLYASKHQLLSCGTCQQVVLEYLSRLHHNEIMAKYGPQTRTNIW